MSGVCVASFNYYKPRPQFIKNHKKTADSKEKPNQRREKRLPIINIRLRVLWGYGG